MSMLINTGKRLNQVKAYLLAYIDQNRLQCNDQLPSEAALAKTLGISRNTLREAYMALESEGVIIRRHGLGTFVARSPVIRDSLNDFSSFAQIIRNGGYSPSFETLSISHDLAPSQAYEVFASPAAEKVRCIKRLVRADKKAVIYVEDYISPAVDETPLDWDSFDGNMVEFLSAMLETPLHQIQTSIRAAALSPEIAPFLELAAGTPVLSCRSTILAVDNQPIAYSLIVFDSNIVELNTVRIIRTP